MQIYIYYFIRANIFIEKFGVGPDGQDPSSGFGCLNVSDLHFILWGPFFRSIFRAPIQAGIRALINFGDFEALGTDLM